MNPYQNLEELKDAFRKGELKGCAVTVDNDSVHLWKGTQAGEGPLFEMHSDDALCQALDMLGIPWEHV
jgi:hypothetical protein